MNTAPRHGNAGNRAQDQYINLVRMIPEVVEVRLADDEEGPMLWTVISAMPFDRGPRNRVYDAQFRVTQRTPNPVTGFRLVNVNELRGTPDDLIGGTVVWSRS